MKFVTHTIVTSKTFENYLHLLRGLLKVRSFMVVIFCLPFHGLSFRNWTFIPGYCIRFWWTSGVRGCPLFIWSTPAMTIPSAVTMFVIGWFGRGVRWRQIQAFSSILILRSLSLELELTEEIAISVLTENEHFLVFTESDSRIEFSSVFSSSIPITTIHDHEAILRIVI